jgi:hypothetical protein
MVQQLSDVAGRQHLQQETPITFDPDEIVPGLRS